MNGNQYATNGEGAEYSSDSNLSRRSSITILNGSTNVAPDLDCFGDDREALSDFERFFNNSLCSDVCLLVGDEM